MAGRRRYARCKQRNKLLQHHRPPRYIKPYAKAATRPRALFGIMRPSWNKRQACSHATPQIACQPPLKSSQNASHYSRGMSSEHVSKPNRGCPPTHAPSSAPQHRQRAPEPPAPPAPTVRGRSSDRQTRHRRRAAAAPSAAWSTGAAKGRAQVVKGLLPTTAALSYSY